MAGPLRTLDSLVDAGLIAPGRRAELEPVAERYAIALSPALAGLIERSDPNDPIARQFVPDVRELETRAQELSDPIGDFAHEPIKGIVHRYRDRVLLKLVHVCPVYCRFCFRRDMVGPGGAAPLAGAALDAALGYIQDHPEIWEVIVTGGDPFIVPARIARAVTTSLSRIAHIKVIRWHTRVPIADPERVSGAFIAAINDEKKAVYVVIHVNHARELSSAARGAIARLNAAGIPLLSQSVLLRGVNDDADVLAELMRTLIEQRVKPYYLHQADLAPGTSHFRVPIDEAQAIVEQLRTRVSGLCMPSFVVDIPGGHGKVPASKSHVQCTEQGTWLVDDRGTAHPYVASRDS